MKNPIFLIPAALLLTGQAIYAAECSIKFDPRSTCDSLAIKAESAMMFFSVMLKRPLPGEENSSENLADQKKWTDSMFAKYDLRSMDTSRRMAGPPDGRYDWGYQFLSMTKKSVLELVEEPFISQINYYSVLPHTGLERRSYGIPLVSEAHTVNVLGRKFDVGSYRSEGVTIRIPKKRPAPGKQGK